MFQSETHNPLTERYLIYSVTNEHETRADTSDPDPGGSRGCDPGLDQQATIEQRTRANLIRKILADYIARLRSLAEKKSKAARGVAPRAAGVPCQWTPIGYRKGPKCQPHPLRFPVGQKLKILSGWNADRTCRVTSVTRSASRSILDNGMYTWWRLDVTGWMPRVEVAK